MIMMKRILLAFFVLSMALSATAQRVYINPGHGDWGPESRPMATIKYENGQTVISQAGDSLGFFESNTNLWKAFALQEKLKAAGYDVMMSRTQNGPTYPYDKETDQERFDKPLTDICAEADLFGAEYFISIHSNAYEDGVALNYPLFLHSGYDGVGFQNERDMALAAWPRHFEAFGNDLDNTNIDHGFEPNSYYSRNEPNLRGDESFYGYNLGALDHSCPGYLVEGYFHTYQPARHRALNPEWCRQEGIRYFRGIQDYYGKSGEDVGYIMGCVRSLTEMFSHDYYIPMSGTNDEFLPINGAKVVLRDASDNIVPTECYRHVARHMPDEYYYTTDNNYNGIFVFENLDPGEYTLTVHAAGYKDTSMIVDVTANATVYPEIFLTKGQGTEPQIDVDVTWVLNGGKVDGTLPSKIEGSAYTLPTPTKAGYLFRGWYANAEGTGTALETLEPGYEGTVYALWKSTSVTWQLNGGHISENKLLWEDFQNYFNEYYGTNYDHRQINDVLTFWSKGNDGSCSILVADPAKNPSDYWWLGHYLWNKANPHIAPGSGNEYIWWGNLLNAFLNCTKYDFYCHHCSAYVTVDFTEAGKYDNWKSWATEEIRQKVTLPNQITSPYTIPTPEREGFTFQGWYNNPKGEGDPIFELPAHYGGTIYAIWQEPVPCIVAYDLNCNYLIGKMAFEFSFYANTLPTAGKLIFYNMNKEPIGNMNEEPEPIGEYTIDNLRQGKNTVVINAGDIPELIEGRDFLWEVHLEAPPSTLFAEIFRSQPFNTAYATIDNSPESDFFGSIWVANQKEHLYSDGQISGEILRLVPERGYARDEGAFARGFEVIFRPTVAPDGKVYITDNGKSHGGVYVMDPHTPESTTNFFDGCSNYENGEWKDVKDAWKAKNGEWKDQSDEWEDYNNKVVGSGSTGAHIYWTEDGNNKNGFHPEEPKLFLMHNAHATGDDNGITKGFFVYDLMRTGPHTHTRLQHYEDQANFNSGTISPFVNTQITDYAIVGTSRGAWVCQLRKEDKNVISDPSLTFYPSDNSTPTIFTRSLDTSVGGIFGDNELIHGSFGSAIAVNKTENLLAMVGGTGNIMLFDIKWSNETTPTLTNKRDYSIVADDSNTTGEWDIPTITTLNFDYAGNLVATLGETYNDASDQHQVVIFTLPKTPNHIDVPSRFSQRVPSLVEDDQCNSIAEVNTTYETVDIYRNLQAGMYNTICLPFGINSLEGTPYQGASVVKFVGTEIQKVGGEDVLKLNFQELKFQDGDIMVAGEPYLIKPLRDIKEPVRVANVSTSVNDKDIAGKSIKPASSAATFHGITSPVEIQEDPKILFLVANNRLATASSTGMMMANRAYFELDNAQILPKRSIISIVKSTPAGLEEIYNTYQTEAYKMLYNGMIVIVRDGVMYDLMGTRIK